MTGPLPAARPPFNPEAAPYWEAAAEGRLVLPVCDACGHHIWYPRSWCPVCGSDSVTWRELSGKGVVYACTVIRRSMGPWAEATPYVAAYVELAEGPRVLANVVDADPEHVAVGTPVTAMFVPADGGEGSGDADRPAPAILRFTPDR